MKFKSVFQGVTMQRVVVTGIGIISAIGQNVKEYGQSLRAGRCGIETLKNRKGPTISVTIGAEIGEFSLENQLQSFTELSEDFKQNAFYATKRSPLAIQASLVSALEAWENAQLHHRPISTERLGIVVAGHNLTQQYQYENYPKFQQTPEYLSPRYPLHFMDTDQVGTLSEIFQIHGEGFTVGGASASGNVAIIKGYQLIQLGLVDACLVVGAMADLSPMDLQGFYNLGAMGGKRFVDEPKKACRPFDKDHEGFIYGQASGCLILESQQSAVKRGVQPVAEMLAGAVVLEGNRLADPSEKCEIRAMEAALSQAKIQPNEVDYLNAHGTSSPLGDETEINAIQQVFREHSSRLWINSTKGLTGHCLYSAGVVEAIATLIQMRDGFVHPNRNLDNPIDNRVRFSGSVSLPAQIEMAMSNSFGFGGINSSIIFVNGEW
jgi:malonyl-ACP decarboxylase